MRKTFKKAIATAAFAATIGTTMGTAAQAAAFSPNWYQDAASGNWRIRNAASQNVTNAWLCDDGVAENGQNVWYMLDANGDMISGGLIQDGTGNFYSLETEHNGYFGMLRYQNGTYNGVYLEFNQEHNGSFGAITNAAGIEAMKAQFGVKQVNLDNSGIVYSSSFGTKGSVIGAGATGGSGAGGGQVYAPDTEDVYSIDSSRYANTLSLNSAEREAVNAFKAEYIKAGMSDFEKEMAIIQYLVANVSYDYDNYKANTIPYESFNVEGALLNGVAVCSGYARAFMALAESCGLTVKYVRSNDHAWNMIKLDGDWYHVDTCWEDPVPTNNYGWGNLRNKYINVPYSTIRGAGHHVLACSAPDANGYKYGPEVVAQYMKSGSVDTSYAKSPSDYKAEAQQHNEELLNGVNLSFTYAGNEDAANRIADGINGAMSRGEASFTYAIKMDGFNADTKGRTRLIAAEKEIMTLINSKLKTGEYGVYEFKNNFLTDGMTGAVKNNAEYFVAPGKATMKYEADRQAKEAAEAAKVISGTVSFYDAATNKLIASATAKSTRGTAFDPTEFVDSYKRTKLDGSTIDHIKVKKGDVSCSDGCLTIAQGCTYFNVSVYVNVPKQETAVTNNTVKEEVKQEVKQDVQPETKAEEKQEETQAETNAQEETAENGGEEA